MAKRRRNDDDYAAPKGEKGALPRPAVPGRGTQVACLQCRTRKSMCSLRGPACCGCLNRGEGDLCSFQALLWIDDPEDLPSRQLKRKLDRLEELMSLVSGDTTPSNAASPPQPSERPRASSAPVPPSVPSSGDSTVCLVVGYNYVVQNRMADALTRQILGGGDLPELNALNLDAASLFTALQQIEHCEAAPLPFFHLPTPASLHAVISPDEYERTVTAVTPTLTQAQMFLSAFFTLANGLFRLVHPPTFLARCDSFWRTGSVPEPAWVSTYFLACGLGLMLSPDPPSGSGTVVPTGPAKELLARTWIDAGRRVLATLMNDARIEPTVESIRAFCLLLQWWMSEGGRHLEASLSLTANVVSSMYDLQLNRDPREVAPSLSACEAELRRRLFWTLHAFESVARPMLGKTWQPFDENEISVDFPTDLLDGEIVAPAYPLYPLAQAGLLNFRISKALTRRTGTSPEEVSKIFDELDDFLRDHSEHEFVAAMARYSYYRLYRFAVKANFVDEKQEFLARMHVGDLFASVDSAEMENAAAAPYNLLRVLATAVSVAVDLNQMPRHLAESSPGYKQLRELLYSLYTRPIAPKATRMVRRAVAIIEHLVPRSTPCGYVLPGPAFAAKSVSDFSLTSSSGLPTPSTVGPAPEDYKAYAPPGSVIYHTQQFFSADVVPASPPVKAALHRGALGALPALDPPQGPSSTRHASRPALSLLTTVAPPALSTKAPTPLTVSPWIDAAITPSRYAGDFSWNPQF